MELRIPGMQNPNPELEEIRNRVLQESCRNNKEWIYQLINRTSKIHAGFLFEDKKTLQDLCLFVGETQNKISDPGWEAFGHHLGLNPCVLKVINHNNFNKEDPTYNLLLAFVQFENATIGKVVQALLDIGRLDVITRIRKYLNDLADIVLQHRNNLNINSSSEVSDYGSMQMTNERSNTSSSSDSESSDTRNINAPQEIIRPFIVPPAPFIFQNIQATPELTSQRIEQSLNSRTTCSSNSDNDYIIIREHYTRSEQNREPCSVDSIQRGNINETKKLTKKRYGKIFMLTFATDGEKYVQDICKVLRRERDCSPRNGVLVLAEHTAEVMKDPHRFITGCFHQVDYICPILTESYLKLINRKENACNLSDVHLDARYAQFIYALMNNYYVSNGCLNDKIRCIIPDELLSVVRSNLLMSVPIFAAWVKLSEVEELAVRLSKSRN
ncbi:UNVERIFIED_CONTAM: hypothetical protein PYX00_007043 [Menopon gallinae]|uniref:Death domain-containing protein n=1 Tax=Menopon gallinae TaxID=328185 RepID=A0AAW2HHC1_9NEOP